MAGLFYYYIQIKYAEKYKKYRLSLKPIKTSQLKKEIVYSLISSLIFAILGALILTSWIHGGTAIYTDWQEHSWYISGLSFILFVFLHETYYYWLHRWMHRPQIFHLIHHTHHESLTPTAWTSFSFHPIESVLQALPIMVMIYLIPIHLSLLIVFLVMMTVTSVINHLNHELYPSGSHTHWIGRWWIGATHHHLHHAEFNTNFGLYFTCWDHWMKTESKNYFTLFEKKTKQSNAKNI